MKRFLLTGTVFCAAAILGIGVTLFLPSNAVACICDFYDPQVMFECDSPLCSAPTPHALFDCFTCVGTGAPCSCTFRECRTRCPNPI